MERFASRKNVEAALKTLGVTIPGEWLARISLYGHDAFVRLLADAVDGNAAQVNALRVLAENLTEEGIGRLLACTGATDEQIAAVLFIRPLRTASATTLLANPQSPKHTERREIYQAHAKILVDKGHAYPCFCTPERLDKVRKEQMERKENPHYDGTCRVLDPDEAAKRSKR